MQGFGANKTLHFMTTTFWAQLLLGVMFYTLYHIFKKESIHGRGTIKGRGMIKDRGMIKGRHLALYQIFKTTVFTTKYMINII